MADIQQEWDASLTDLPSASSLNGLTNGSWVSLGVLDFSSGEYFDCALHIKVNPNGTVASNKQVLIFGRASLDGTNFAAASIDTNHEPAFRLLGSIPCPVNSTAELSQALSVAAAYNWLPPKVEILAKNEAGVSLHGSTGNEAKYRRLKLKTVG